MTKQDVLNQINRRRLRFQEDYGVPPFDVCLGPEEFALVNDNAPASNAPLWIFGMRVRQLKTENPGVLVGCLNLKE